MYIGNERMPGEKAFIAFPEQVVEPGFRKMAVKFFDQRCRKDHITDECGLDDQNFFKRAAHSGSEDRRAGKRMQRICPELLQMSDKRGEAAEARNGFFAGAAG